MNRRGFLASILAAGTAPLVLRSGIARGIIMPVREIVVPDTPAVLFYNGIPYTFTVHATNAYGSPHPLMLHRVVSAVGLTEAPYARRGVNEPIRHEAG